jgi:hypothetical protein
MLHALRRSLILAYCFGRSHGLGRLAGMKMTQRNHLKPVRASSGAIRWIRDVPGVIPLLLVPPPPAHPSPAFIPRCTHAQSKISS